VSKNLKELVASVVILLVSLAGVAVFSKYTPYLESLELRNYDFLMAVIRGPLPSPGDIVVIAVDEASDSEFESSYGVRWPYPRGFHGELVDALNVAGVKTIIFDVAFLGKSDDTVEDETFIGALKRSKAPVVIAASIDVVDDPRFSMVQELLPYEPFVEAGGHIGFATLNPDSDGVIRHGRLSVGLRPTLTTEALTLMGLPAAVETLPVAEYEGDDPEILVNYVGGGRTIPTVSYYQALDPATYLPSGFLEGKIVFVGRSLAVADLSSGGQDHYPSPFDTLSGLTTMPGVEIHANLMNTLLTRDFIYQVGVRIQWIIIISLGLLVCGAVLITDRFALKIILSLSVILGYMAIVALLFKIAGIWLYAVQPVTLMITVFGLNTLYQYRLHEKERAHIRKALSGYVSKQVMGEILKNPDQLELGGTQVEATVLFSDIAGFSKISEKITPRELASLLNDYFTRMGDIIMSRDGMINKYIGDAVMAIWNAPLPNRDHARLACQAALEMRRAVADMYPLRMRVGINTGQMVAGNLGHRERMEYTVIGDAVNLASRLEGANKAFGTVILISDTTEALVRDSFLLRQVDRIRVIGKEQPVEIFEVVAERKKLVPDETLMMLDSFNRIIKTYDSRDWVEACRLCESHLGEFPGDLVTEAYMRRCQKFREHPPDDDWDGVFSLESK
jgi:adenylate cyclase